MCVGLLESEREREREREIKREREREREDTVEIECVCQTGQQNASSSIFPSRSRKVTKNENMDLS